jgi:peroxiredoxin (alkyl hydroperoxide reductase subunit C)
MLTVGDEFPSFELCAVKSGNNLSSSDPFVTIKNSDYNKKWLVVFFWPKDFTFVCPTEIVEFGSKIKDFEKENTQLLGISTDSEFAHLEWKKNNKKLTDLPYPMLSDIKHDLCNKLGVLNKIGVANRATFIVDDKNIIRSISVIDLDVGRNVDEVLRLLIALQTGKLTPCNWSPGEDTIN